jgi:hypothetical protein
MAIMPGVAWRPVPVSGSRPRRARGRGVCLHVAVSEAASLFPYFSTASVDSHFYVTRSGSIEQYVDTDLVAYAQLDGNATLISVETQGGVTSPETEPWTAQQIDALARICGCAHDVDGVPLQLMRDSRATSRGVGYHRLGVDPWRVPDGERWSTVYGKTCPGSAKVAQIPQILTRATQIIGGDDMALTDADIERIAQRTRQVVADGTLPYGLDTLRRRLDVLEQRIIAADANDDPDALAAAIVAAIPADLAQQVVDKLAERLAS